MTTDYPDKTSTEAGENIQRVQPHFPWEQWSQLPKVEREAEIKEFAKQFATVEADDAVGYHKPQIPFPYYDFIEIGGRERSNQSQIDPLTRYHSTQIEIAAETGSGDFSYEPQAINEAPVTTGYGFEPTVQGDQLEIVGANETCQQVGDPRTGVFQMVCNQYSNY